MIYAEVKGRTPGFNQQIQEIRNISHVWFLLWHLFVCLLSLTWGVIQSCHVDTDYGKKGSALFDAAYLPANANAAELLSFKTEIA